LTALHHQRHVNKELTMQPMLQTVFRGMEPSPTIEARVRGQVAVLERFAKDIVSCRVVIEQHHLHQHQGRPFAVSIELTTPGGQLVVNRAENPAFDVALHDAFNRMQRRLEDAVRRRRGDVKLHTRLSQDSGPRPPAAGESKEPPMPDAAEG
jgi:ribosome-associated translation inhibitor RaiA